MYYAIRLLQDEEKRVLCNQIDEFGILDTIS